MSKKNELELLLLCAKKALEKVVFEKPSAGVITNRGKKNEAKMRYFEALEGMQKLHTYFALRGAFSFGVCKSCTKWTTKGHNSVGDAVGDCKRIGKTVCCYNSCDQHSKRGGGFGL